MMRPQKEDTPFPLKRYYLFYGGIGSLLFYVLLFTLFIRAERRALYDEYIHSVSARAQSLYSDIQRDFLTPRGIGIQDVQSAAPKIKQGLRTEIRQFFAVDLNLEKLKILKSNGIILYDHGAPEQEGTLYDSREEAGFVSALSGRIFHVIEVEDNGRRLIEAYLPIENEATGEVIAVLEIYEDVSRFEAQVKQALKSALILPTLIFAAFSLALYLIVAKADRIIERDTKLLIAIRRNMEKYLSPPAVSAIYQAVSQKKQLFRGDRQSIVVLFSDIRGFTAYSEATEPETVVKNLNHLFEIQAAAFHKYGGSIDKFVGDEIMVVFDGGQESEAVTAAVELLNTLSRRPDIGLKIGIGIHSGQAVVGSIGTKERRDYTAIGDTVNTGARLCSASPPESLCISSGLYEPLPPELRSLFKAEKQMRLKGKQDPMTVHIFSPS